MSSSVLGFLGNVANTAENDVAGAAKTVMNYINQPKQRIKEQPQAPTRTKNNGQISQAVQGYIRSSTGSPTQMGVVDPNASPGKQVGQALSAPIDPASDALSMGAGAVHSLLPLGIGAVKATDEGASFMSKIFGRPNIPPSPVRISLPASVYGAGHEKAVQATVDNIVPGATALEKYTNLEPTMARLGDRINQVMQANPQSTSLDQILSDFDKNLQDNGIYRTAENAKNTVQKTATGYINDLVNAAGGNGQTVNPTQITDQALQKMKQSVNQDAQSVFKKIANGTSLSDKDNVILQARQTVDDALTSIHPEIKNLTTMQSHLYDAADSLFKGREQEIKNTVADTGKGNPLVGAAKTIGKYLAGSPLRAVETTGAGLGLALAGKLGLDYLASAHSVPTNFKNASIPPTTNLQINGQPISQSNLSGYLSASQQLTQESNNVSKALALGLPNAKAMQIQYQNDQAQFDKQYGGMKQAITLNTNYKNVTNQLAQVEKDSQNADLGISGILQSIPYVNNVLQAKAQADTKYGKYYTDVTTLVNMAKQYGIPVDASVLLGATTKANANELLNSLSSTIQSQYQQDLKNNGITVTQGQPPATNNQTQQQTTTTQIDNLNTPSSTPTLAAPAGTTPTPGQTIDQGLMKFIPPSMLNQVQGAGGGGYTASSLLEKILASAHSSV